jgi:tRNA pseudouridine38-40 synthase
MTTTKDASGSNATAIGTKEPPTDTTTTPIKLIVEYDGSRYSGFQRQVSNVQRPPKRPRYDDNGRKKGVSCTIQDCIEDACLMWKPSADIESLRLRFAGRTDKGVHARGQVAIVNFDGEEEDWEIVKAINSRLPMDVSVRTAERCSPTFDPRKACVRKQYTYSIRFCPLQRDDKTGEVLPISKVGPHGIRTAHDSPCLWVCPWALDEALIPSICKDLSGTHDYSAFIHKHDRTTRDYTIGLPTFEFEILEETKEPIPYITARFRLEAKSFGRAMVRNLVGFVVDVSRGQVPIENVPQMWDAEKSSLVCSAPASGLCLEHVWYE